MSRILILISCSGSKREGGGTIYNANNSILNYLTGSSREHLLNLRRKLFEYFFIQFGRDVDYPNDRTINYMEAYQRYTGDNSQIYRQISFSSWNKLKETVNLDLVIISALYGLLRYNEAIQYYNKKMPDKIGHQTLKTWWRNNGLCVILKVYIDKNNISEVHNVLSNDYNEALRDCFVDMEVKYVYQDFSDYKSGSNAYRGKWVNDFIQNI